MITDAQKDKTTFTKLGYLSPSFKCSTVGGENIDISKLPGKVVMINFFAIWCPPCNLELPALQDKIWGKYKNFDDFALLVVGRDHNEKTINDFSAEKGFDMPFTADPNREIYNLFASQYIPRNIIIDRDGKVIFQNRGYTVKEFIMIEEILSEKLVHYKTGNTESK